MNITLLRIIFFTTCITALLPASAQVRRTYNVSPASPSQQTYAEVYEYDYVDQQPQFPGGERALLNFINETREYPYEAYKNNIEGRVLCSFIIGPDGCVSHISIVRGASNELLNREAVRVISQMPKWNAGRVDGEAVATRCYLPIPFRL